MDGADVEGLPLGWDEMKNAKGDVRYIHEESGTVSKETPVSIDIGWQMVKNSKGEAIYVHDSGTVSKDRPISQTTGVNKNDADPDPLPLGWEVARNAKGEVRYMHEESGTVSKDRPVPIDGEWQMVKNSKGDTIYVHESGTVTKEKPIFQNTSLERSGTDVNPLPPGSTHIDVKDLHPQGAAASGDDAGHLPDGTEYQEGKERNRQGSDVLVASIDPRIRKRLAGLLSEAAQDRGGQHRLLQMLSCEQNIVEGMSKNDAALCIMEWMKERDYTVEYLATVFDTFEVQPDLYSLIEEMTIPDALVASIDPRIRKGLAVLLSIAAQNRGGHPLLLEMLSCDEDITEGKSENDAAICIMEWLTERDYTVGYLATIFETFEVQPDIYALIEELQNEYSSGDVESSSQKDKSEGPSETRTGSTQDITNRQHGEWYLSGRVRELADMLSEYPGLFIKGFRCKDEELVVYCDIDQTKHITDTTELCERASVIMDNQVVHIKEDDVPMIKPSAGPKVGIGGIVTSCTTMQSSRVAGYLSDGRANAYAATVAHVFGDVASLDEPGAGYCLLAEYQGTKQYVSRCIAKCLNLNFYSRMHYDICFVKSLEPLEYRHLTNVFKVGGGGTGIDAWLLPSLPRIETMRSLRNGVEVFVCKLAPSGITPKGRIEYIQVNRDGTPTFFGIAPLEMANGPVTEQSDSGSLVTITTPQASGVVPVTHMDCVEALGIVVGVDADGTTVALPFWPQLAKLCSDHDSLRDKADALVFMA